MCRVINFSSLLDKWRFGIGGIESVFAYIQGRVHLEAVEEQKFKMGLGHWSSATASTKVKMKGKRVKRKKGEVEKST